jgi:hypothetical protein
MIISFDMDFEGLRVRQRGSCDSQLSGIPADSALSGDGAKP